MAIGLDESTDPDPADAVTIGTDSSTEHDSAATRDGSPAAPMSAVGGVDARGAAKPQRGRRWLQALGVVGAMAGVTTWSIQGFGTRAVPPATAVVARRDLSATVVATGTVKAVVGGEVKVGSRVPGRVEHLAVQIGDRVRPGQVIARLEQDELRAGVDKARAELAAAEARRAEAAQDLRIVRETTETAIARGTAQLSAARAKLKVVLDGARPEEIAQAEAALRQAEAVLAEARANAGQVGVKEHELQAAERQVDQARAGLRIAEANLGYATITAPISGVVASVSTQPGETVTSGSAAAQAPTFVTIIDLGRLEVHAYVDETDIGKIAPGQSATFTVDAYPDGEFTGTVIAIYPKAVIQLNVVTYEVIVAADNPEGRLRPDMTANVTITVARREQVLAIPSAAVMREDSERYALVQTGEQTARRAIKTGSRDKTYVEVLSGLREGERVVVGEATKTTTATPGATSPPGAR